MSDFKAKMHRIRFAPDPTGGAYSVPPDPLAVFKGPTSKGREGKGGEGFRSPPILRWHRAPEGLIRHCAFTSEIKAQHKIATRTYEPS